MKSILPRLHVEFPFLHSRAATEADFYDMCDRHAVTVVQRPDCPHGLYVMAAGEHFIFLNACLTGWRLRYVMFHEAAHFLFHAPSRSNLTVEFFSRDLRQKNHHEAETVAALLLLPIPELEEVLLSGAYEAITELAELVAHRLTIYHDHKI